MNDPTRSSTRLRQRFEEYLPVPVIQKNSITAIPSTHDVVDGTIILYRGGLGIDNDAKTSGAGCQYLIPGTAP